MAEGENWDFGMRPCPRCRTMISQEAKVCRSCGGLVAPLVIADDDASMRMVLPVGRPASAIAAGYLGLFSVLPFFGILAIAVSLFALRTLKRNPHLSGRGRAYFGLVMGLLFTLIYGFAILAAVLAPRH